MSMRLLVWYFGTGGDCKVLGRNCDEPEVEIESSSEHMPMLLARFKMRGRKRDPLELVLFTDEASSLVGAILL